MRASENGKFALAGITPGQYTLLIAYPGYADYEDSVTMDDNKDLGTVSMLTRAVLLQNVIVRGSPIRMKGDTLAYMADSFKVQEGASVEDLLKRLPGMQVNSKGEITAQGQRVQKVLVDGEEFFGDDPTMATQNLRADMVKEVEVFDKKSEQAAFTGVDDGEKTKTINLKLKEDAKKGYFGKVNAGGGLPDRWNNEAMINNFKGSKKLSAYGLMSNTSKARLDWRDETNYGGGMDNNTEVTDDGGIMIWSQSDEFDWNPNSYNEGLPKAWTAGMHYGNKINNDRDKVNAAYRYRKMNNEGGSTITTQYMLPYTQFVNNETSSFSSQRMRHKANGSYELNLDSTQTLTIRADAAYGTSQSAGSYTSEGLSPKNLPINTSLRNTTTDAQNNNFNSSALWRKKFKMPRRTISLNLNQQYNLSNGTGFLYNENSLFTNGSLEKIDTTDQRKENNSRSLTLNGKVAYTEPLGKRSTLELSFSQSIANSESERLSYDKLNGKYDLLNNTFSNRFEFNSATSNTGLGYRYSYKKITAGAGGNVAITNWKQNDLIRDTTSSLNFTNFLARANLSYKIKQQTFLRFNYDANTQNPTINQLQPVADNNNPLNIQIGNPNLKLSFRQNFMLSFNDYKVLGGRSIWAYVSFSPSSNDFSTRSFVDEFGRMVTQTVNVKGNFNFYSNANLDFELGKSDWNLGFGGGFSGSRYHNYVNTSFNRTDNRQFQFSVSANKSKEKKYSLYFGTEVAYNTSKSSIRPDINTRYWTWEPNLNLTLELPLGIRLNNDLNYNWRQKTDVFTDNNNVLLWHVNLDKKVSKKHDLRAGLRVNDLLNQNIGFSRSINSNFISERSSVVLQRYWLVSLVWNFSKNGKPSEW